MNLIDEILETLPVGSILPFAKGFEEHADFAPFDGRVLYRPVYPDLFSVFEVTLSNEQDNVAREFWVGWGGEFETNRLRLPNVEVWEQSKVHKMVFGYYHEDAPEITLAIRAKRARNEQHGTG